MVMVCNEALPVSGTDAATRPLHVSSAEPEILRHSAEMLQIPEISAAVRRLVAHRAYVDAALSIIGSALPGYGLKLVIPPPLPTGESAQVFASVWRRGESHAVFHRATTAALALLNAAECECAKRRNARLSGGCARCGGAVTTAGTKEICLHDTA
jgi:hypothetical protein